ncbi:type I methionyl aminopeptidase [Enterobacteriaceae endosymbiont of Macroplea appendiculata]|uniref:type I methionyl aminopeptidase n=1 Tax=Enterobacteriaceae endosymbiont of Macroplea appendiculata TaxID=2675790 RepID=UPI001449A808|nr:type I methionyl aminopeptidase [Enterobacteriaceae endosymbiont of Macroplea appendiculata]QJC30846.1 type I methionyl aminopeptidase [Enterobacteriaceae endosymbiont of Macroplea appendiculata]
MNILIKKASEINKIIQSCKLATEVLEMIDLYIIPGISTEQLNCICHDYIINVQKAKPATLGYKGYPKSVCISRNDVVCHGIPNKNEILCNGDIINIDVTVLYNGYYGDTSKMFYVGNNISSKLRKLCNVTQNSLYKAIKIIKPGLRLYLIGKTIQQYVENENFSVVRNYCGHGIGKNFHEEPQILHYNAYDYGVILQEGMIFTIEPMVNIGSKDVYVANDGWTVKTQDKSFSAQYEHTILVTKNGYQILTLRQEEKNILLK